MEASSSIPLSPLSIVLKLDIVSAMNLPRTRYRPKINDPVFSIRIFDSISGKVLFEDVTQTHHNNYNPLLNYQRTVELGAVEGPPRLDLYLWDKAVQPNRYAGCVTIPLNT